MGYEAYKLAAKFQNLTMADIVGELRINGAIPVERFGGTVTMEIPKSTGVIELVLREGSSVNTRFSPGEKVLLGVRFAKVSDVRLVNDVITLLKKLAAKFDVMYVRDGETGRNLDLNDTAWLMKAVTYAKYDFEYYFPVKRTPVRCRDVFCLCGNEFPQSIADRLS
ncbi:MAG: hypothetical protein GXY05_14185 [Clostridiales bacterium]|nr:hypothetical protein [Clostridiales bacterium]